MTAVIAPEIVKSLPTFAGETLLARVRGTLGPKLTDWIGSIGWAGWVSLSAVHHGAEHHVACRSAQRPSGPTHAGE